MVGGAIHGLGTVLTEEFAYDEDDQPLSANFTSYAMLSAGEQPPIESAFVESPTPLNPLGAKGIGEAGTIGTPAAVANAVTAALGGRWVDPPFTPEKLWRALGEPVSGAGMPGCGRSAAPDAARDARRPTGPPPLADDARHPRLDHPEHAVDPETDSQPSE